MVVACPLLPPVLKSVVVLGLLLAMDVVEVAACILHVHFVRLIESTGVP